MSTTKWQADAVEDEARRWPIADRLNDIPAACWSQLVDWAIDGHTEVEDEDGEVTTSPVPPTSGGAWCAMDAATHPDHSCYCGKFRASRAVTS